MYSEFPSAGVSATLCRKCEVGQSHQMKVQEKRATDERPHVQGKFLFLGDEKLYIRGVTYGPFRPEEGSDETYKPEVVERDFAAMAANGVNAVRTYTVPPLWLLDAAQRHGLRAMVGLPWEQHVAFLDDGERARSIEQRVRAGVAACAGHPAVMCYAIGNEIPAPIVRWYSHGRIERFLEHLYRAAKTEDSGGLFTYVNYPSTEYLQLPLLDFVTFNVYLEEKERLEAYLARLHNLADDRPVVMAEIGLDSRRNGEEVQARSLDWQIRTTFAAGCAGAFVFAWTDEWYRGGYDIEDWDFGLTRRDRSAKPALTAVREAFAEVPFPPDVPWPRISVVVCSHNGELTLPDCLEGLSKLRYPNFEVIVVDDGSTDATADVARNYGYHPITTSKLGLGNARNVGMEAATGEIVAYLDDDTRPDPDWLTHLAAVFMSTERAGVGGPNISASGDGLIADCVAKAPGNPVHILLSDSEAEHIPGCNMAFRKDCLQAIGGFDLRFRVAGDDVDACWRMHERGWTLGYSPAAVVWHHRRNSIRSYWRQQLGYGKAEALLERKWPQKYNAAGHVSWAGRIYGEGLLRDLAWRRRRVYHGVWGSAPFQSVYGPAPSGLFSMAAMPEWYLAIFGLGALSAVGLLWAPLFLALPLFVLAICLLLVQASLNAARAPFKEPEKGSTNPSRLYHLKLRGLTAFLHLLQPLARLWSRMRHGLVPWRHGPRGLAPPWPQTIVAWSERWRAAEQWLILIEATLCARHVAVSRGGEYDRWDLEVRRGMLGTVRLSMLIEEHGAGRQLLRFRIGPSLKFSAPVLAATLLFALGLGAALQGAWVACAILGGVAFLLAVGVFQSYAAAMAAVLRTLREISEEEQEVRMLGSERSAFLGLGAMANALLIRARMRF
jgi:GT2 family glycosyltransferase